MGARQQAAAELARELSLASLETPLARLLSSDRAEVEPRAAAARALLRLDSARNIPSVTALLRDAAVPEGLRAKLGSSLVEQGSEEALATVILALREAPRRLQAQLATALAGRREGAETLLLNIEAGKLSPSLLMERQVKDLKIHDLPLPQGLIPRLIKQMSPANRPPELSADGLALQTPPYIADARVSDGRITLYKSLPGR